MQSRGGSSPRLPGQTGWSPWCFHGGTEQDNETKNIKSYMTIFHCLIYKVSHGPLKDISALEQYVTELWSDRRSDLLSALKLSALIPYSCKCEGKNEIVKSLLLLLSGWSAYHFLTCMWLVTEMVVLIWTDEHDPLRYLEILPTDEPSLWIFTLPFLTSWLIQFFHDFTQQNVGNHTHHHSQHHVIRLLFFSSKTTGSFFYLNTLNKSHNLSKRN